MRDGNSYRTILRSSSIMGGASVINVLVGLFRTKVAALILGPVGVGLIGLLVNFMLTSATIAALGIGTSGTRQITDAHAKGNVTEVVIARRALFWGTLVLASIGTLV